jgi:multiple sugar transport system permease protein
MKTLVPRPVGLAVVTFCLLVYGVPTFWLLASSLRTQSGIVADAGTPIFSPTLDGYRSAISQGALTAIGNSFVIAAGTTVVVAVIGVPAAYWLARTRARLLSLSLFCLILVQMLPTAVAAIPLFRVLATWRLDGSLGGVVLATAAALLPFAVLMMRPFFTAVPEELYEQASLDGAPQWRELWSVGLPIVRNGAFTVLALVFIIGWGEFVYAATFLNDQGQYPVTVLIAQQADVYGTNWPALMALSVLGSLPVVGAFILAQRRLVEGMAAGAVKA